MRGNDAGRLESPAAPRAEEPVNAEQLVQIVESSMSAPIYGLLKRPDELHVVEQAHAHARFVED